MANGQVQRCGVNGCRNPIREGAAGCWRHPDGLPTDDLSLKNQAVQLDTDARKNAFDTGLGQQDRASYSPTVGVFSPLQMSERLLINGSVIAEDAARSVAKITDEMSLKHPLDVPSYLDTHQHEVLDDFRSALEAEGMSGRVIELKLIGINRLTPKGRTQSQPEGTHTALLIDPGNREHSVVLDPTVARLAPVVDRDRSVLDTYAVVGSPLADIPYVEAPGKYVHGDYLWFDQAQAGS